jgi:hypothetical protein
VLVQGFACPFAPCVLRNIAAMGFTGRKAAYNNNRAAKRKQEQSMKPATTACFAMIIALGFLGACGAGGNPFQRSAEGGPADTSVATARSVKLVERDVEAPDVFQVADAALWDGRPSLGGVWVASPNARDPERVIMRNPANGKFVIGALFRRERDNPGPSLQISSDAAAALGMLAGQPANISVTALRRQDAAPEISPSAPILDAAETLQTEVLPSSAPSPAPLAAAAPAAPAPSAPAAIAAPITGQFIQIGFFSVKANAERAVSTLQAAGIAASIRNETSQGKPYWSVGTRGDAAVLAKIKAAGFKDAYITKG